MSGQRSQGWNRRAFVKGATLAGTGALLGLRSESPAAEPPPETTEIRLLQVPTFCVAPQYVAEQLLRDEGFADIQYIKKTAKENAPALASGEANLSMNFAAPLVLHLEAGDPLVVLAGVHVGCFELFGRGQVRAIRDLKGKAVGVPTLGNGPHLLISIMAAYVGLDPRKDITWVIHPPAESMRLLAEGKIDAYMGFLPDSQELRAKKIGHVIVNTMMDRPWSQYFCCLVGANKEFVRKNPVATKRALRAILKGADICAREPQRVARFLVDKGYAQNYGYALQTMKEMQMAYGVWREYDPEDTVRFYALQLQEIGMIKSSPQKIIAQGTDWRFLRELKKELKA
jgi:NitT/TauT family transport system substrate-binding protein